MNANIEVKLKRRSKQIRGEKNNLKLMQNIMYSLQMILFPKTLFRLLKSIKQVNVKCQTFNKNFKQQCRRFSGNIKFHQNYLFQIQLEVIKIISNSFKTKVLEKNSLL